MENTTALITSKGIMYQNKFFTCSRAISEQWFDHGSPYYMLEIQVHSENDLLLIMLDSGEAIAVHRIPILNTHSQRELDSYFTKLNELKLVKKLLKNEKG
ncbi:hypothetical protein A8990_1436 [Paenibacillus taihuensis]|uniref:Uncharacterized protein n=1 Tax=Paenibacillus taihuensis TaxID=1156355 RepID=A0A3D9QU52_9BACL|nr:hypothetical protein [Paenibacillus taihuensis]REE67301.1 hypothetical protein A8990_1436 [Paenibacillus taihuensis]